MTNKDTLEVIYVQFGLITLRKVLKQIQNYFELVVWSSLPRRILDAILAEMPEIRNFFSHVLAMEDGIVQDDYLVRDVSKLLGGRDLNNIYIIESNPNAVDPDSVVSI